MITGTTTVFPGVTLNIDPGVVVKVKSATLFSIRGRLNINGAENDSVLFTAAAVNTLYPKESWDQLIIEIAQGGTVKARYLIFEYCSQGFILNPGNSTNLVYDFKYCTFRNNNIALKSNGDDGSHSSSITNCNFSNNLISAHGLTNAVFDQCSFKNGSIGVSGSYTTTLTNSEFSDLLTGISLDKATVDNCYIHHCDMGATLWPGLTITNCRIEYNKVGLAGSYPYAYSATSIHDNIICGNTYGLKWNSAYPYDISNNCWCLDEANMPTTIYDAYDDPTLGIVSYDPIITGCTITPPRVVVTPPVTDPPVTDPPVTDPPVTTSIVPGAAAKNKLMVFPNPASESLHFNNAINGIITICSSDSKVVSQQQLSDSKVNVAGLASGYYIISIQTDNDLYHATFIKE